MEGVRDTIERGRHVKNSIKEQWKSEGSTHPTSPHLPTLTSGTSTTAHGEPAVSTPMARYSAPPAPSNGTPASSGRPTSVIRVAAMTALDQASPTWSRVSWRRGLAACGGSEGGGGVLKGGANTQGNGLAYPTGTHNPKIPFFQPPSMKMIYLCRCRHSRDPGGRAVV